MSRPPRHREAAAFREALSQWQLAARTEVKRSSSLPSSMFDAADPMLEAGLAQSVEAMMRCLHEPRTAPTAPDDGGNARRTESVDPEELRQLPSLVRGELAPADLDEGLAAEFLNVLVDACTTGDDPTRQAARRLLDREFAIPDDRGLEAAAAALLASARQALMHATGDREAGVGDERLAEVCHRLAAAAFGDAPDERSDERTDERTDEEDERA